MCPPGRQNTHYLLSTEFIRLQWSLKSFENVQDLWSRPFSFESLPVGFTVLKAVNWGESVLVMIGWLEKIDFFSACTKEKSYTGNRTEWGCGKSIGLGICYSLGCTSRMLLMKSEKIGFCGDLDDLTSFISLEFIKGLCAAGLCASKKFIILKFELQRKSLLLYIMLRLSIKWWPESKEDKMLRCAWW